MGDLFARIWEFATAVLTLWTAWVTGVPFVIEQGLPYLPESWRQWLDQRWPEEGRYPVLKKVAIAGLALACFQAFDNINTKYKETDSKLKTATSVQTFLSNRWEPLSGEEAVRLKAGLRKLEKVKVIALCNYPGCNDFSFSLADALSDVGWEQSVDPGFGATATGLHLWSSHKQAQAFADVLEVSTNGRAKPMVHTKDEGEQLVPTDYLVLVVGRRK